MGNDRNITTGKRTGRAPAAPQAPPGTAYRAANGGLESDPAEQGNSMAWPVQQAHFGTTFCRFPVSNVVHSKKIAAASTSRKHSPPKNMASPAQPKKNRRKGTSGRARKQGSADLNHKT